MTPIGIRLTLNGQKEVSDGLKQVGNDVNGLSNAGSKFAGLSQGMGQAALSAGQLKQATQQLPLQFQDIVVSLQAGQQPLTVFLQQGSQLAGSFGGAGAAVKAMSGYVLGLVNPLTVAGAAVVGFGLAMASVEKTLRADTAWQVYADATGRGVDLSVEAMKRLRGEMMQMPGVSKSMATEMLGDLAGMRDLSTKAFGDIALMAADMAVLMRTDVPTAAKELAKAMSDPAKGVSELNDKLRVLSAQQVATAQAMADAGDKAGAQAYVLDQLKTATQGLAHEGLTPLQQATNQFGNAWSEAMAGMGDGGPLQTANELMAGLVRHTADAVQWLGQLKPPAWLEDSAKGGLNGWVFRAITGESKPQFTGGASGGWGPNTGGASGSWGPAPTPSAGQAAGSAAGQTDWDREIEALLKATAGYKTTSQAMSDLREQAGKLQEKLQDLRARGEGGSALAQKTTAALDGINERLANLGKNGGSAAKTAQTSYQSLLSTINQKIVAMQTEVKTGEKLTETEKLRARYQEEINTKGRQYTAQHRERIEAGLILLEQEEKQKIAAQDLAKAHEDDAKALERLVQQRERSVQTLEQSVRAARDEEQAAALAAASNITHAEAIAQIASARADDAYMQALANGEAPKTLEFLEREMKARRDLTQLMGQKGVREANAKAAKDAASDWEKTSQTIGDTLADYIMGGGKDAATYLKRLFSTLVLQPVVQYGVNSAMGALGMGQQGSAVNSVLGGNNVGTTVLNNAGAIGAGFQAMYGMSVGASSASLLGANAVGMVGGDALGALAAANGMWAGVATGAQAAAQSAIAANVAMEAGTAAALEAGTLAAAQGAATGAAAGASSIMSGIATAAPYLAAALAVYAIAKSFDDSGTLHYGAGAVYSGGKLQTGADIYNRDTFGMGSRGEWNANAQQNASGIAASLGAALDGFAVGFGQKAGYTVATAFADDSSDDGAWGSLRIADAMGNALVDWENSRSSKWAPKEFASGDEGYKQYLNAVAVDVKSAFLTMDLPGWADQLLNAATDLDALNVALGQIAASKAGLDALGQSMSMFKGISEELQTQLLATAGSMQNLSSIAGSYYGSSLYSEYERMAKLREQQMNALSGLGLAIDPVQGDQAKEQFRAAVEQAMAAGKGELAVQLMAMSASFAQLADYAQGMLDDIADTARSAALASAEAGADQAWRNFEAAIDREKAYWQGIASASQEAISQITGSVQLLQSTARDLYGTVDSTQQMLAAQGMVYVENALAAVRAGSGITGFDGLQEAITAARGGISGGVYASEFERQRDTLVLAGQLSELGDLGDAQLSVEERSLKAAQEQIGQLDQTLEHWQQQLDGTAQLIDGNLSISASINALAAAIAARDAAQKVASGGGGGGGRPANGINDSTLKQVGDAWASGDWITAQNMIRGLGIGNQQLQDAFDLNHADLRYLYSHGYTGQNPGQYSFKADTAEGVYAEAKAQGLSLSDVNQILGAGAGEAEEWAKKMGLPVFHGGTPYVPKTGFAVLQEGEAVVPKAFNPWVGGAGVQQSGNAEVVAELRALREQNARLEARLASIEKSTGQFAQQFDNVSAGGHEIPVLIVNQTISAEVVA